MDGPERDKWRQRCQLVRRLFCTYRGDFKLGFRTEDMPPIELDYEAITLDTSIIDQYGLNLERGLLRQLAQFEHSPVTFLISEVVLEEVRKHMLEATKTSRAKIQASMKAARASFGLTEEKSNELERELLGSKSDSEIVDARIEEFIKSTGAVIARATGIDVDRLLTAYFESEPPFEGSGDKKAEFPDAIALLSIEEWARENNANVLAVSKDSGWLSFAKVSSCITAIESLPDALVHFQPHNAAADIVEALQLQILNKASTEILAILNDFIVEAVNEAEVDVEYGSAVHAELNETEIYHKAHSFVLNSAGKPIIDVIRIEANWLSLRLRVSIEYEVHASFSMAVWDSIDREYVPIGSSNAASKDFYECDVLLSLTGDFSKGIEQTAVGEFGIDLRLPGVDIGEVEATMHDE